MGGSGILPPVKRNGKEFYDPDEEDGCLPVFLMLPIIFMFLIGGVTWIKMT